MAGVSERWAKPVIPEGVEEAGKSLLVGGVRYDIPTYFLSHDNVERVRLGYVCISCLEQHEVPYPVRCQVCAFPIRAIQDQVFEKLYEGEAEIGPKTDLSSELEIAKEIVDRGSQR